MDKKDLILGKNALKEAIAAQADIQKIFIAENLDPEDSRHFYKLARSQNIPILKVPKAKLDRLSRQNHQGIIALVSPIHFNDVQNLVDGLFFQGIDPALAICDGITDVRNFGAIARSAEVFGMHGLVIGEKNSAPVNGESIKSSAGALLRLPVCREKNLFHSLKQLKSSGLVLICASEQAEMTLREVDLNKPLAFVFGSEGKGPSSEILGLSDEQVKIPQRGQIESLNVSVAAGIFFYEWMLQSQNN